ncbi:hypothetical protein BS47DRAFT_1326273 [Hydnum rufescens UP504]|uniref:Cation efflux protein n=1 Tax=Hydnum rufescens UP504 TaxID=1448309 RepID=A0A9P6B758_9AGAM|nr:hypothetical protein BS47DRAFT_1326273 [Hydnum rufescens UP504]
MRRSTKIWTLLIIDSLFLLVELVVGYAVGSLALVADSFHMLNDVMSLVVALYAIKVSTNSPDSKYSYGWHRAEILAALINGVFLLALCLSIFLEAIVRFFSVPEISNPKLVVIVGSLGLGSNILGLFLFHEHDHSHEHDTSSVHESPNKTKASTAVVSETTPLLIPHSHERGRGGSSRPRSGSAVAIFGHPAQTRAHVVQAAEQAGYHRHHTPSSITDRLLDQNFISPPEDAVAIDIEIDHSESGANKPPPAQHSPTRVRGDGHSHLEGTSLEAGSNPHAHGHSHDHAETQSNMNMRALLLHVLGDALGNVGVVASGLIIWLTTWPGKYYSDPIISLVITVIIFTSALPLVKSASFILLQGVPTSIELDALREDIINVPGVLALHELHVWQLSESKNVASVHVWVAREVEYMGIASAIRQVLHQYNVHSCTIQPEFRSGDHGDDPQLTIAKGAHCLIPCAPSSECPKESTCCRKLESMLLAFCLY